MNLSPTRIPPQSIEAEKSLLASALYYPEVSSQFPGFSAEIFYRDAHKIIAGAIRSIVEENGMVDLVTTVTRLKEYKALEECGGPSYLAQLSETVPSAAAAENYIAIIKHKHTLRRVIEAAANVTAKCFEDIGEPAEEVLADLDLILYEATGEEKKTGWVKIGDIVDKEIDKVNKLSTGELTTAGLATGYPDLDRMTAGFQPSDLIILAGRPSMGKTALAMNIADNVADAGGVVAVFSLEMNRAGLGLRNLSGASGVDSYKLRSGKVADREWPGLTHAAGRIKQRKIFVDDTAGVSIVEMRQKSLRLHKDHGLNLLVVDYLQMATAKSGNREGEVAAISRGLKAIAKDLDIPVLGLAQLNRGLESRVDKRPLLSDLRESGAIEQDADVVCCLYRDEVYNTAPDNPRKGIAELLIRKQRNGPIGTVELTFDGSTTRFNSVYKMHMDV